MNNKNIIAIGRSRYLYNSILFLIEHGYTFEAIVSDESYEEYDITLNDFRELSEKLGCSFFVGKELYSEELAELIRSRNIRCAISVNWRLTLTTQFLQLFELGIINFHLGSLPDYKGNATANWAIINGEDIIHASIHKMEPDLDAGDIIARAPISIHATTDVGEIIQQAELLVPSLYKEALDRLYENKDYFLIKGTVEGSRCYPRLKEDSHINWNATAIEVDRLIRASAKPFTGAFTFLNGEPIIIWKAVIHETLSPFFAMPGHIVKLQRDTRNVLVACKDALIELQEIEHNGNVQKPMDFFKSIRLRLK